MVSNIGYSNKTRVKFSHYKSSLCEKTSIKFLENQCSIVSTYCACVCPSDSSTTPSALWTPWRMTTICGNENFGKLNTFLKDTWIMEWNGRFFDLLFQNCAHDVKDPMRGLEENFTTYFNTMWKSRKEPTRYWDNIHVFMTKASRGACYIIKW